MSSSRDRVALAVAEESSGFAAGRLRSRRRQAAPPPPHATEVNRPNISSTALPCPDLIGSSTRGGVGDDRCGVVKESCEVVVGVWTRPVTMTTAEADTARQHCPRPFTLGPGHHGESQLNQRGCLRLEADNRLLLSLPLTAPVVFALTLSLRIAVLRCCWLSVTG